MKKCEYKHKFMRSTNNQQSIYYSFPTKISNKKLIPGPNDSHISTVQSKIYYITIHTCNGKKCIWCLRNAKISTLNNIIYHKMRKWLQPTEDSLSCINIKEQLKHSDLSHSRPAMRAFAWYFNLLFFSNKQVFR